MDNNEPRNEDDNTPTVAETNAKFSQPIRVVSDARQGETLPQGVTRPGEASAPQGGSGTSEATPGMSANVVVEPGASAPAAPEEAPAPENPPMTAREEREAASATPVKSAADNSNTEESKTAKSKSK
jgi:hypothetical protein